MGKFTLGIALVVSFSVSAQATEVVYGGSSFRELRELIFRPADPADPEAGPYIRGVLPEYKVTSASFWGYVKGKLNHMLTRDARRTVNRLDDQFPHIAKLVHANGICFTGEWIVNQRTPWTGYFAGGARGLFIGRASTANSRIKRGEKRTFGFAGKIFPTLDPDQVVPTMNFVTIDNLGGTKTPHYLDVSLTNEPPTGFDFTPRLSLEIFYAFNLADKKINFRPVTPIAEYGVGEGGNVLSPRWLMMKPRKGTRVLDEADFRDELNLQARGEPLVFDLYATSKTKDPSALKDWSRIGEIRLTESVVSLGCDKRIHFHHNKIGQKL